MQKKYIWFLAALAIIGGAVLITSFSPERGAEKNSNSSQPPKNVEGTEEELCLRSSGAWKDMSTPCAGTCDWERGGKAGKLCAQVITQSCECGTGKCWNGKSCEEL